MSSEAVITPSLEELSEADAKGMTLALWAERTPDVTALVCPNGARTFGELNARANRLASALRARGLVAGQALALVCGNRLEFLEAAAACMRIGVRYTPINWHLAPAEARYIIEDCDAHAVVVEDCFAELASELPSAVTIRVAIGEPDAIAQRAELAGFEAYEDVLASGSADNVPDPQAGTSMLYTSGTTGHPKGVVRRPVPRALARLTRTFEAAGYRPGGLDMHLCTGPLYHAAPLMISLLTPLSDGASVCVMGKWDAAECLELMARQRITHTHMVPTMFHRLLQLPEDVRERLKPSHLRFLVHGAAPCPVPTKKAMMAWLGPIIWEYYAATEGAGTVVSPQEWLSHPGTVGKPMLAEQIRILDDDREPLPAGQAGTVFLRLPDGFEFHYHKAQEKTAASRSGRYYTLGDVGYLDEDGYLFLTDRSADLIISGGVNIYPAEVEAALHTHPAVLDVAVIGVPNEEWGEEVKAVVELSPGQAGDAALSRVLIEHCRGRLAHFKCPRSVDFVESLPRHDNGKLYKRRLRELYRAQSGG